MDVGTLKTYNIKSKLRLIRDAIEHVKKEDLR